MLAQSTTADHRIEDDPQWVTIDEAVDLTGDHVRNWRRRAAFLANRGQAEKNPPRGGKGKRIWWISRAADPRLTTCPVRDVRDERSRASLLDRYPVDYVERAYRRAFWMHEWHKRRNEPRVAGRTQRDISRAVCEEAQRVEGPAFKINPRSLQLWFKGYNAVVNGGIVGVEALVDGYRAKDKQTRSPEAIEFFYDLYRTENKLTLRECHLRTWHEARTRGWQWPNSYGATRSWIDKHDDRSTTHLERHGKSSWSKRFMPYLTMDWSVIPPGHMYVSDHKQCDFVVCDRDKQFRPWLTAVQDCGSRCIVGWHLGPSPHTDAILAAMRGAFRDWAVPAVMRIDNGKDFTSKAIVGMTKGEVREMRRERGGWWKDWFQRLREVERSERAWLGVLPELGVDLIFAIPYSPWSKGTLERWFRTFGDQCCRTFATWCGDKPQTKPEALAEILGDGAHVPTLDDARTVIGEYIGDRYHHTSHRGQGMKDRTPWEVWQTARSLRRADQDALALLMSMRGKYRVTGNGVTVTQGNDRIAYGAKSPALQRYVGRDVLIAAEGDAIGSVYAIDPATSRLIASLSSNAPVHPDANTQDVRDAVAESRRDQAVGDKAQRASKRRTVTLTERINRTKAAQLATRRATGTDDAAPNVIAVTTGFEGLSNVIQRTVEPFSTDVMVEARKRLAALKEEAPVEPNKESVWARIARATSDK